MSMSDPIADLLTRIRNANLRYKMNLSVPTSKMKYSILSVLEKEGFIKSFQEKEGKPFNTLEITLKYHSSVPVIRKLLRISKPGLRHYVKAAELKPVMNGQGIAIVSTSKGVLSDRECRRQNIGGELLCKIW